MRKTIRVGRIAFQFLREVSNFTREDVIVPELTWTGNLVHCTWHARASSLRPGAGNDHQRIWRHANL